MKLKNKYLNVIFSVILFSACNKESSDVDYNTIVKEDIKLENEFNLINYKKTVYQNYFLQANNKVEISALKSNSISDYTVMQNINYNKEKVQININSSEASNLHKKISKNDPLISEIYGKNVSFTVQLKNANGLENKSNVQIDMYVPNLVEITSPKIEKQEELFPICYFDNFIIEWNADSNNEEGLVVIAEYFGNNIVPSESTNTHILNTAYIEKDSGKTILDVELFKDIPDLSLVHIILLHGNVKVEEIQGEMYKFVAESHVRLPIILSKDLDNLKK